MATGNEILKALAEQVAALATAFNNQSAATQERLARLESTPKVAESKAARVEKAAKAVSDITPEVAMRNLLEAHRTHRTEPNADGVMLTFAGGLAHGVVVVVTPTGGKAVQTPIAKGKGNIAYAKSMVLAGLKAGHKVEVREGGAK